MRRFLMGLCALCATATVAQAQPSPLIHLDVNELSSGTEVLEWVNQGTLGNSFVVFAQPTTLTTVVQDVAGQKAVFFYNGSAGFTSDIDVPGSVQMNNPWTVHARVYQEEVGFEETIFAWGRRGGPDSTNAAFMYGTAELFGAIQHWGAPDMGYDGGVPEAGVWHDIAVTFDGSTERVYVDGVENASEAKSLLIGANADTPRKFLVGFSTNQAGESFSQPYVDGAIQVVQMFDSSLSAAQVGLLSSDDPSLPTPLVRLDASALPEGELTSWTNEGSLGGTFAQRKQVEDLGIPTVTTVDSEKGLRFDGTNGYVGADGFEIPALIQGNNPWTFFARVHNPSIEFEEPILEWAARGGPDGTYAYAGFGNADIWGVAAHWGAPDMGFATEPTPNEWHNLAITFDGTTEKIYVDGVLDSEEDKTLNIGGNAGEQVFRIGMFSGMGVPRSTFTVNVIEMFSGALTEAQLQSLPAGPAVNAVQDWMLLD